MRSHGGRAGDGGGRVWTKGEGFEEGRTRSLRIRRKSAEQGRGGVEGVRGSDTEGTGVESRGRNSVGCIKSRSAGMLYSLGRRAGWVRRLGRRAG
jgi:hypothetical protein